MNSVKNLRTAAVGAALGGSLLFAAGVGIAGGEPLPVPPPPGPDGVVNVVVGTATLLDSVPTAEATDAVADKCKVPVETVSAMVVQVDATGVSQTACTGQPGGDVVLTQNAVAGGSPVVPDTSAGVVEEQPADPAAPAESEESIEGDLGGAGAAEPPEAPEEEGPEPNNMPGMN
ncbi:hypothetical protein BH10ACT9_BH10ACT9_46530 [soil metagenome]